MEKKPSRARRKIEWWLRPKERVSMDGKDEMNKEVHARYKTRWDQRGGGRSREVSDQLKGHANAVVRCLAHENLADIVRGLSIASSSSAPLKSSSSFLADIGYFSTQARSQDIRLQIQWVLFSSSALLPDIYFLA